MTNFLLCLLYYLVIRNQDSTLINFVKLDVMNGEKKFFFLLCYENELSEFVEKLLGNTMPSLTAVLPNICIL